jgi:hypothetical protein
MNRSTLLVFAGLSLLGCKEEPNPGEGPPAPKPVSSAAPKAAATTAPAELCKIVLGAPRQNLEGSCTPEEKKEKAYEYLVGLADNGVTMCGSWLQADADAKRLAIDEAKARACGLALSRRSWKDTLLARSVAVFPECRDLVLGTGAEGGACRSDGGCAAGLHCAGALTGTEDGVCKPAGVADGACTGRGGTGLGWLVRPSCAPGLRCTGSHASRSYPLGLDESARDAAMSPALKDAEEFGMIGLLNSAEGGLARGLDLVLAGQEPVASDPVPDAPPGRPNRYGFGSGRGRLGKPAPKVRMGQTNVSGRLPPEVIQRIVRQSFGRFRLCYENGLRNDPTLAGRVTVQFVINREGKVENAKAEGDLADKAVTACVGRAFFGLEFPQPEGGIVTVSYPIVFEPSDAPPAASGSAAASAAPSSSAPPPAPRAADTCVAIPPVCTSDADCSGVAWCLGGSCKDVLSAEGEACDDTVDCQPGFYCHWDASSEAADPPHGGCASRKLAGESCVTSLECVGICRAAKCASFCDGP